MHCTAIVAVAHEGKQVQPLNYNMDLQFLKQTQQLSFSSTQHCTIKLQ